MSNLTRFRCWVPSTGTRVMEYICGLVLCAFALNIIFASEIIWEMQGYREFMSAPVFWYYILFVVGALQLITAPMTSARANRFSAFLLMVAAVILSVFAIGLYIPTGVNTGVTTYSILAFFALLAWQHLMSVSIEDEV